MSEFHESILVCAVIFVGLGGGVIVFHGIGLLIRRLWAIWQTKKMVGPRYLRRVK